MVDTPAVPQRAFVIGPIGDKDAPHGSPERHVYEEAVQVLEDVILPACSAFGLTATRADSIARPGEIPDQVFRLLRDSEVVIADLTGANANVMYELGLRHTTGKLTIQLGERERLPFDISVIRTILFKRTEGGLIDARKRLSQAIAAGLADGGDPVTATRLWFESSQLVSVAPLLSDGTEEEVGFLEKLAEMEEGMTTVTPILGNVVTVTNEISQYFTDSTGETNVLAKQSSGAGPILQAANRLALRLEDPASRLEVLVGEYSQSIRRIDPGVTFLIQRLIDEPEQRGAAPAFVQMIRGLVTAVEASIPATGTFRDSIRATGAATRPLKRVTHRIASSYESFVASSGLLLNWRQLLDRIPPRSIEGGV